VHEYTVKFANQNRGHTHILVNPSDIICSLVKLYNDQRNAQIFNLFIYLLLSYMFRAFY
jgi:hypothetical protein